MLVLRGYSQMMRLLACLLTFQTALAQSSTTSLDISSPDGIRKATKTIAEYIFTIYVGDQPGETPGVLPGNGQDGGYYWWIGGGLFGTMVNYWHHTGDDTFVEKTRQAISFQSAPTDQNGCCFQPSNESFQLGNDDISFWAFAALQAAEYNFPAPPKGYPSWLAMVQAVFNRQAFRWDNVCGGGLRWQVTNIQGDGYFYKNSITNGAFFQIASRLGRYTGNQTYLHWADRTYNWITSKGLITPDYTIYDGIITADCKFTNHTDRWSYNVGVWLYGAATMWNVTQKPQWKTRVTGLLEASRFFLKEGTNGAVVTETICEISGSCQIDQSTFKGYLIRWMRATVEVAAWTKPTVEDILGPSAAAAAAVCNTPGDTGGTECGLQWYTGEFDNIIGVGENMNAMEILQTLLPASGPLTAKTGGKSKSQPAIGGSADDPASIATDGTASNVISVSAGDKAGAAILTILLTVSTLAGAWWIVVK